MSLAMTGRMGYSSVQVLKTPVASGNPRSSVVVFLRLLLSMDGVRQFARLAAWLATCFHTLSTFIAENNGGGCQNSARRRTMSNITIGTSAIRQLDGFYSLNDLHKASGGELKHRPVEFLRLEQTKALVEEIQKGGNHHLLATKVTLGRHGGTYVCKELVYAYAMWISPKFNLTVIRAFDAMHYTAPPPTLKNSRWLLSYDHEARARLLPIAPDCAVMNAAQFLKAMVEPNGAYVDTETLVDFIGAAIKKLNRRHEFYLSKTTGKMVQLAM